jgi:DNA polymerase IV
MLAHNPSADRSALGAGHEPQVEPVRPRKIIHIDMDAFYASVEQRDNPELRGKPVAVGGSRERGVVAAASYEARKFGVRSAMPSITAKRQCPDLIFVKPRFDAYRAVSLQIREIFAEHTPLIEPLSLDEAYLDVTENLQGIGTATEIAEQIRAKILAETGLTASAGVSYNKFLAKLASDHRKPNGLFVITPKMGPVFVENLPVGKFHGVGPGDHGENEPARDRDTSASFPIFFALLQTPRTSFANYGRPGNSHPNALQGGSFCLSLPLLRRAKLAAENPGNAGSAKLFCF